MRLMREELLKIINDFERAIEHANELNEIQGRKERVTATFENFISYLKRGWL